MKRLNIINHPTAVDDLADFDTDNYTNTWQLRVERLEARQHRRFKQQMA